MTDQAIRALRLSRQRLTEPVADRDDFLALFRLMQPVKPIAFSCPGDPPSLFPRCALGDARFTQPLRAARTLIKGRFQGGLIGYILADELPLYAAVYRRPCDLTDPLLGRLYELIEREGPLTIGQIKETTGMLVKEITPALQKLQQAFLVYEDQTDCDWERGFYALAREFPQIETLPPKADALTVLLTRLFEAAVFCDPAGLQSATGLSKRELSAATGALEAAGLLLPCVFEGTAGFVRREDAALLAALSDARPTPSVFVLHLSDFLVKCSAPSLKKRFPGANALQYLLIDGSFAGVVTGKWRQGPHEIWDILTTLPAEEAEARREELLGAVRAVYPHLPEKDYSLSAAGAGTLG